MIFIMSKNQICHLSAYRHQSSSSYQGAYRLLANKYDKDTFFCKSVRGFGAQLSLPGYYSVIVIYGMGRENQQFARVLGSCHVKLNHLR